MNTSGLRSTVVLFTFFFIGTLTLKAQPATAAKPAAAAATAESVLLTTEGKVEISRAGNTAWAAAQTNSVLSPGDRIRTGLRSRAVVRLANLSTLRVNELTTFVVQPPSAPGKTGRIDVQSGSTYFFSRERPADVEFSTPLSSGAIRGTEFNLAVADNGRSVVTLIDGALSLTNSYGSLDLASGEEATVEPGQAPKKTAVINAINVIQWCLYYPGVLDADELGLTATEQQDLADSLAAYRSGDLLAALADYPAGRSPSSDADKIYFAQLLLAAGQVEQAETQLNAVGSSAPLAGALREVIAAVKNRTWVRPAPSALAGEWLADSYYLQSRGKLDEALAAARKAVAKSPNFGFGWERVAELEFSFGRVSAATVALDMALTRSLRNAEAVSLKGFLLAARNQNAAARKQFDRAIALDGALGNAWLGRGLMRIHAGDATGGRQDLQVAATVEPQRAVLRSYLGKAFANANDSRHAEKEFALAQKLDPNDPTVWLYAALLNEQENRVNDAVGDLEKSQDLNNNRSVYRSQLLLDQDRAVRGANLANIYSDEGMSDVSTREAVRAVNADYANYSSHLFLANSYFDLLDPNRVNLRYETAYDDEFLIANLLAPAGASSLSQQVSQQEYSRLFEHDGVGAVSDTRYQSNGDWVQALTEYGHYGNSAFAFEQDYSLLHGISPNSEQDRTFDFRFKQQLTPKDSLFLDVELAYAAGGKLAPVYDPTTINLDPSHANDRQEPLITAGLHHEWSPGVDTLLTASWLNDANSAQDPISPSYIISRDTAGGTLEGVIPYNANLAYRSILEIYSLEGQQIWQTHKFTTIVGARYQTGTFHAENLQTNFDTGFVDLFPSQVIANQNVAADFERESVYGYEQWRPVDSLEFIGGVSYDRLRIPEDFRFAPVSANSVTRYHLLPKGGIIWTPLRNTVVRAGFSQSVGGASLDQDFQIEPTQVAGFNQMFRSLIPEAVANANAGAKFNVAGISLEQKLPTRTYLAVEGDLLSSRVNRQDGVFEIDFDTFGAQPSLSTLGERLDFTEATLTASAHQLLGRDWALGAVYRFSRASLNDSFPEVTPDVASGSGFTSSYYLRGVIQSLDLDAVYQNPCGFFARVDALWTQQQNQGYTPAEPGDNFWQGNVQAGWRFFQRRAELSAGVLNVAGRNYHLNPLNVYQALPRDRVFFTQFKIQF
ncbi:MAG TPA: TonB-dependent receptor [Candidatus Acidoferrales bacterium]|jgi:tetratricopeptide (TPR) repeat protein|nr:TonB-dependent receptor [Candidatus Acidoferrales bacterium]